MSDSRPPKKHFRRLIKNLILVAVIGFGALWALQNRWLIQDQISALSYEPTSQEQNILDELKLTKRADLTARASHFKLQNKQEFSSTCPVNSFESGNVLGCYTNNKIYSLLVDEPTLDGIEQATTAHEILHANFARMSSSTKKELSLELSSFYDSIKNKAEFKRTNEIVEQYAKQLGANTEAFHNELFAVYGTQVSQLSPRLESYYLKVFEDRNLIVSFYANYSAEFIKLEEQINNFDKKLADLKGQKAKLESDLQKIDSELSARKPKLDNPQGSFTSQSEYEAAVISYNSLVNQYNSKVKAINELVKEHNQILAERNKSALAINQLNDELTTRTLK